MLSHERHSSSNHHSMSENWRAADKDVEHPRCREFPMLVLLPPPPVAVVGGKNVFGLPQRFFSAAVGSS
jgi:hypothetical protein